MRLPKVTEIPPQHERVDADAFATDTHQLWPATDGQARTDAADTDSERHDD